MDWNRQKNNNAKRQIQRVKQKLVDLQRSDQGNKGEKTAKLRRKLVEAYRRKEVYWGQKARSNWLKEGDKNTMYFHAIVEGRRKRNNISTLHKSDGN